MYSIPTTQPTVDLSSYVEQRGIIVLVQWFGTTVAVEAVVCTRIHVVSVIVKYLGHRKKQLEKKGKLFKNSNETLENRELLIRVLIQIPGTNKKGGSAITCTDCVHTVEWVKLKQRLIAFFRYL
jgi:hypothetical protein